MRYFALCNDGRVYDLCDCGDFDAAEESARDVIPDGYTAIWIADENTASQWALRIINSLFQD